MAEMAATFQASFSDGQNLQAEFADTLDNINADFGEVQRMSTSDYEGLYNRPKINGVELLGDKSFEELGEKKLTNIEIATIFKKVFGGK